MLFYQNCAKLNIVDLEAASKAAEAERIALGKDDETVVVGVNAVPDLKMFFVVDNSGTMKQNQLNLSDSFGAMFDASSSDSLSKFDTTAILISTAQKSSSFSTDKASLDSIATEQKGYTFGMTATSSQFVASMRSALYNFGLLPGDNIGYQLTSSSNPLKYTFLPAPVLGTTTSAASTVSFQPVIRKLASENSAVLETEFKNRLSVLNSERIPLALTGGQYKPLHSDIVDTESGLCAIARILRNPDQTIKSGDLLSFTVVSDENDNDPKGLNCIQSVTQYTGTEDLVDGDCKQRETTISYQSTTTSKAPDSCKLNGNVGYNYKITYAGTNVTTQITYKSVSKAAQYKADYYNLVYKAQSTSYQYLNTNISYYVQTCVDVVSDNLVIGQKCSIGSTPVTASKAGDFTGDCYAFAKSLNSQAVNSAGNVPVCSTVYKSISSCLGTDSNCKVNVTTNDKTVAGLIGSVDVAGCLAKAKSYSDYSSLGVPTCTAAPKTVASCSAAEQAAGCTLISPAVYANTTVVASGDKTVGPNDCMNYAKTLSGNAVSSLADISQCAKIETPQNFNYSGVLSFVDTKTLDGGNTIALNADCGAIKNLAYTKAVAANSAIPATNTCIISGYAKASETSEALTSDCVTQANNRCSNQSLRSCVGTLVVGATTNVTGSLVAFKKVQEDIKCTSKCSDSKLGACNADVSDITVAQYLKNQLGSTVSCTAVTSEIATSKESKVAQLASGIDKICSTSITGVPSYFTQTKGPYRTSSVEIDYVAGTVKDSNGVSSPAKNLVDYIQARSAELSNGSAIFSALVRRPTDTLGAGGSYGTDYESLITQTKGQIGSVLSNDYSVALKDLGRVIKNNIQRTLVMKKMKANQVIKTVFRVVPNNGTLEIIDSALWSQNGASLIFNSGIDLNDGDQFKVEYQNY